MPEFKKMLWKETYWNAKMKSRNSTIELKTSLKKIKELKRKIEELETALQNCKLRVELFEANNEHWKEQLHRSQG
ncbi:hypothetical protein PVK06_044031 [Gossypium arboreum]|uniref:Uncharacterized protein n=1 Tax=Gossypium arboreum TaxID=29729 RepID=A0ABR0MS26_GOSAR|nr:hypothetical protein PVK06_044031 [Gossypium arboreum]